MSRLAYWGALVVAALALSAPPVAANDWSPSLETSLPVPDLGELPPEIAALRDSVDAEEMWRLDSALTDRPTNSPRVAGSPGNELARGLIEGWFEEAGLVVAKQEFTTTLPRTSVGPVPVEVENPRSFMNILGIYPGRNLTKWVLVGGHYDTLPTQGAIDNGAGTVHAVHLAQVFGRMKPDLEATVVFAAWDGEELGLYGSTRFVEDPTPAKIALGLSADAKVTILAALSYDMVGVNWPARNPFPTYEGGEYALLNLRTAPAEHCGDTSYGCDRYTEEDLANFSLFQSLVKGVAYGEMALPSEWVKVFDDGYGRSDHVPFIRAGIPGMRVQGSHDEEYPYYHTVLDNLTMVDRTIGKAAVLEAWGVTGRLGALVVGLLASAGDLEAVLPANATADPDAPSAPLEEPLPAAGPVTLAALAGLAAWGRRRLRGAKAA